ncbi:PEP-CTERM sorting domain-containing protein, partial [Haloferula sp. A504]|uniref:PEP-CTERM sorting domain-containing protein n=1 Tax=Haloferula sp. A504 TaxID=3373601 RepID=UPI0031BFFDF7|nr:PEP-CTERM sorting domain-containing protein [Verrucomicrobiaceae bacterium E54]
DRRLDPGSGGGAAIAAGTDLSGFTGLISVEGNQNFWFASSVATATFGLHVVDADNNYVMQSGVDVKVTSGVFGSTMLPAGTYTGSDLISDYSLGAYITDNGGTITVIPEPTSLALLGLGGLIVIHRRRR